MHRSRINGLLIDCNTDDIDAAAKFWAEALGRRVDPDHPGSRGNYRMLETPEDEFSVLTHNAVLHHSRMLSDEAMEAFIDDATRLVVGYLKN